MIWWILGGLLVLAAGFFLLLHPEKLEWLSALQARMQKWKPRTVRRTVLCIVALAVLVAALYLLGGLPDWAFLLAALVLLAAELAVVLLYYRCPRCGHIACGERRCGRCGEPLPWDESDRRNL